MTDEATTSNHHTIHLPKRGRRMRLVTLVYGIIVFLWLSPEDNSAISVTILGTGLSTLLVTRWVLGKLGGISLPIQFAILGAALLGVVIGVSASISTGLLMLLKNARHAHLFPDYPPGMMLGILERTPVWALSGGLVGLGLMLAWLALRVSER